MAANISRLTGDVRRVELLRAAAQDVLGDRVTELEADVTPSAWTGVTFQNSWVNNGSAGQPNVAYRKVGDMVHLRGSMKNGTANAVCFTLPSGFRPAYNFVFPVASETGNGHVDLDFNANGNVSITNYFNDTVGTYIYIPYIVFSVTA